MRVSRKLLLISLLVIIVIGVAFALGFKGANLPTSLVQLTTPIRIESKVSGSKISYNDKKALQTFFNELNAGSEGYFDQPTGTFKKVTSLKVELVEKPQELFALNWKAEDGSEIAGPSSDYVIENQTIIVRIHLPETITSKQSEYANDQLVKVLTASVDKRSQIDPENIIRLPGEQLYQQYYQKYLVNNPDIFIKVENR